MNLVVKVTLQNLVIEMCVVFCVSQKITVARQYQRLLVYALFQCVNVPFKGSYMEVTFLVELQSKKSFLTPRHIYQRLVFAQKYRKWSAEDWEHIIWTDESTFEIGKNSRQVRVWRTANERYSSNCIVPTFKSGRTSLMIWGAYAGGQK